MRRLRIGVVLACAAISLGLFSVAAAPAAAGARGPGEVAAAKKKCKKARKAVKKKCARPKRNGQAPTAPPPPSPGQGSPGSGAYPGSAVVDTGTGCGAPIAKGDGSDWECTFSDNFEGTALNRSKWLPTKTSETGYLNGPTACFVDTPNNISVSNGTLKLRARREAAPFNCVGSFTMQYTSGSVSTAQGRFSQTYGRFEIRAKVPPAQVKGLQSSLWLWPDDAARYGAYPASGEIDIAEMYSQYPDRAIPYVHYNPLLLVDPLATNTLCFISNPDAFHTYALEWTPTTLTFSYDGQICLVDTWAPALPLQRPQPFNQPFFVALTQALGVGTNTFDPNTTPLPATTEVDYVRVWK